MVTDNPTRISTTDLDDVDWAILTELQRDGRLPMPELARVVRRDDVEVAERTRRLATSGFISGYHARINLAKLGYHVLAIVWLRHASSHPGPLGQVLAQRPEIVECLWVASENCHVLRVAASSTHQLDDVVNALRRCGETTTSIISDVPLPYRGIRLSKSAYSPPAGQDSQMWALS